MQHALEEYIIGQGSIVEIISNSQYFTDMFADEVKSLHAEECVAGDVRNLGMAKHRFSSLTKRLGRFVGKLLAIFRVAERVRSLRRGRVEAQHAERFLGSLLPEHLVQLAMMADAADEAYTLTTFFDDESADTSLQADEVAMFVENCEYLFVEGKVINTCGYTAFAMSVLKHPRVLNVAKACLEETHGMQWQANVIYSMSLNATQIVNMVLPKEASLGLLTNLLGLMES